MTHLAKQAKAASRDVARLATAGKNACLLAMAGALKQHAAAIKEANARDMEIGTTMGLSSAMLDRLKLDDPGMTPASSCSPSGKTPGAISSSRSMP